MPHAKLQAGHDACLLDVLRDATGPSHAALDEKFASLDLDSAEGYSRFLRAHYAGLEPVFGLVRGFARETLKIHCPDLPEMLRRDLADLGADLPERQTLATAVKEPAAVTYVVAGSRLGVASLSRLPYHGKGSGHASRYMEDTSSLALWRAHSDWLRNRTPGTPEARRQATSAVAAFDLFAAALDAAPAVRAA